MGLNHGERAARESRYANALAAVLRHAAYRDGRALDAFHLLTEVGAAELGLARASIWRLRDDGEALELADLHIVADASHTSGTTLERHAAPAYFGAVALRRVIAADDAHTDPATAEFREGYLEPLGISSMLDAPIVLGGSTVGVVCFEHVGPARRFDSEDRAFATSIADLAATILEVERRRVAEDELRSALEAAAMGTFRVDLATSSVRWSDSTAVLYGLTPARKPTTLREWLLLVDADDRDRLGDVLRGVGDEVRSEEFGVPYRLAATAGGTRHLECRGRVETDASGRIVSVHGVVLDVTERKRLDARLAQAARSELLGRFAGGIAHDVNNVLTAIHGYAARLSRRVAGVPLAAHDVAGIQDAVDRAGSLTRQLLMFARRQPVGPGVVEVDPCVRGLLGMLQSLVGEDVAIELELGADSSYAAVEQAQLEQIVVNLVVNARDAMPYGGRVTIRTHATTDGAGLAESTENRAWVTLTVTDTGTGIPRWLLDRILEPFFTTKPEGAGTGLGLSTCVAIATQSGGSLSVESEIGQGASFHVVLPQAAAPLPKEVVKTILPSSARVATILLAEDDEVLRHLSSAGLTEAGHRVVSVAGRAEGLALLDDASASFDLLVSDVVLTDGSGIELAERFRQRWPDRPVLLVSGYAPRALERRGVHIDHAEFLEKPFRPAELCARVAAALLAGSAGRDAVDEPRASE